MTRVGLKIIFFGSSDFAVGILETLSAARYDLVCVVTQSDKRAGRHLNWQATPVKTFAKSLGLKILCPTNLTDVDFSKSLSLLEPDLFVVVSYGAILPKRILEIPRLYAINIHTSLLPCYRGAAPIQRSIMNGDNITGVSIIRMNEKIDEGDIISQVKVSIDENDTAIDLENKLKRVASKQILEVFGLIREKRATFSKQDNCGISFAPKITKHDALIDWKQDAGKIYNQIRACLPWPVAFTYFKGKRIKIFKASIGFKFSVAAKPGEVVSLKDKTIILFTSTSSLQIERLQPENAKIITAAEFISGTRLKIGDIFGG